MLLCCLPTALFVSTVIKAPSPEPNLNVLAGGFGVAAQFRSANFKPRPVVDEERAQVIRDVSADARKPVGVFFPSGNIASLRTGLPNASVLAAPEELTTQRSGDDPGTVAFRRMQCRSLETSQLNSVIAAGRPRDGLDSCAGFSRAKADRGLVVFARDAGGGGAARHRPR